MAIDPKTIKSKTTDGDSVSFFSPREMADRPLTNREKLAKAKLAAGGRIRLHLSKRLRY